MCRLLTNAEVGLRRRGSGEGYRALNPRDNVMISELSMCRIENVVGVKNRTKRLKSRTKRKIRRNMNKLNEIKSKSNVRIERNKEDESCSTT